MCNKVESTSVEKARGFFLKGNEPAPIEMGILVGICECGSTYWAKVENGTVWVIAEKGDERVSDQEAGVFAAEVAGGHLAASQTHR